MIKNPVESVRSPTSGWPILTKSKPGCCSEQAGHEFYEEIGLFWMSNAATRLQEDLRSNGGAIVEVGGILLGDVYRDPASGGLYVQTEDFIRARNTKATPTSLEFTLETFREIFREKDMRFPSKRLVGWFHTHPHPLMPYLSRDDRIMHARLFSASWQVAVVFSGPTLEWAVFRAQGMDFVPVNHTHIV